MNTTKDAKVVYSTTTGEPPKGSPVLTKEATEPLPPPTERIRKTATKKVKPRIKAPARPLDYHTKAHDMVMEAAREIVEGVGQWAGRGYTRIEPIDDETVMVR